jgi:hypothetical protein
MATVNLELPADLVSAAKLDHGNRQQLDLPNLSQRDER